jgi:Ca2+-binding RTX toxin-like protein
MPLPQYMKDKLDIIGAGVRAKVELWLGEVWDHDGPVAQEWRDLMTAWFNSHSKLYVNQSIHGSGADAWATSDTRIAISGDFAKQGVVCYVFDADGQLFAIDQKRAFLHEMAHVLFSTGDGTVTRGGDYLNLLTARVSDVHGDNVTEENRIMNELGDANVRISYGAWMDPAAKPPGPGEPDFTSDPAQVAIYSDPSYQRAFQFGGLDVTGFIPFNVVIVGKYGDDTIKLNGANLHNSSANLVIALDGNDNITGSENNDYIFGGDGNDVLDGDLGGADILVGGLGNDTYFASDGDMILDSTFRASPATGTPIFTDAATPLEGDGRGVVNFEHIVLSGATQNVKCDGSVTALKGASGEIYNRDGNDLKVFYEGKVLLIRDWVNGNLGITLTKVIDQCTPPPPSKFYPGGPPPRPGDPLVLDLDGNGIQFVSLDQSNAHYDFDGTGFAIKTGWIGPNSGFLVHDAGNGHVSLFGNAAQAWCRA